MRIRQGHQEYGAVLFHIACHRRFTAINVFRPGGRKSNCAFVINGETGLYVKYRTKPAGKRRAYAFTFGRGQLASLKLLRVKLRRVFVALVCVEDRAICCLPLADLSRLQESRAQAAGTAENDLAVLVAVSHGRSFKVYVTPPGKKNATLKCLRVPQNAFPEILFED